MVVGVHELIGHVLANPKCYPGPHNVSQERTSRGLQKLDPHRQMALIWDATTRRLRELLDQGESVNIQNFGVFTSEDILGKVRFGKDTHGKRPCFLPSAELKAAIKEWREKEEVLVDRGAISTAQSVPRRTCFLNEVPIASGCYLRGDVVKSALKQLFTAILDLAMRGYELDITFGVARFLCGPGKIKCVFEKAFTAEQAVPPTGGHTAELLSSTWQTPAYSKAMATFVQPGSEEVVQGGRIATANLAVMTRDLTAVTH